MIGWDEEDAALQAEIMTAAELCGNNQGLVKMYQPALMAPAPGAGAARCAPVHITLTALAAPAAPSGRAAARSEADGAGFARSGAAYATGGTFDDKSAATTADAHLRMPQRADDRVHVERERADEVAMVRRAICRTGLARQRAPRFAL